MVELVISNEDEESSPITLQNLIYDQQMSNEEIRSEIDQFLQNLDIVIEFCEQDEFPDLRLLLILPVNPNTVILIQTYLFALLAPLIYQLISNINSSE